MFPPTELDVISTMHMADLLAFKQGSDDTTGLAKDLIGILTIGGFHLTK